MKSVYRNDPVASEAISKLPVDDRAPAETFTRMASISKQWAELPNAPGTNKTFVAGETDQESFDALHASLEKKNQALATCEQQFKARTAALNQQDEQNASFVSAAVAQGRAQFLAGSNERNVIDGIPSEASGESDTAFTPAEPVVLPAPAASPANTTAVSFDLPKAVNQ